MDGARPPDPERVLVLAPTAVDAALSRSIMAEADLACCVATDLPGLARDLTEGAGAVLLTAEVLAAGDTRGIVEVLRAQPTWSDVPILLLSPSGADSSIAAWAMELLGNVTVLERPVRVTTLVSALRTAIKARRRQYELRDQLVELVQAEASLRQRGERLRLLWEAASLLLTAETPDNMMRTLFSSIAPHFKLDAYFNLSVTDAGDGFQVESCYGISEDAVREIARIEFDRTIDVAAESSWPAIVNSGIQQSEDSAVQLMKSAGLRACVSGPLVAEHRILGILSFASRQKDRFEPDEIEFMRTIFRYVTVAYERMHLIRQLQETDRRKDEFLATLAHELRNPLAPIRNALQIMRIKSSDAVAAEQARSMMERQLGQMVRIIDDLLDVSRLSRGKLTLRKERIDLATVINGAVDAARPLIEAAGHKLTVALTPEPIYLDADPTRLAQVFSNLLNNAAKYMDRGGRIWLTATKGDTEVVVSVRDAGIGIPAEALASIFEMFTQVDQSLEKSQGGLGIGLMLVKQLVEMHGGSVVAYSEGIGKGARFNVHLPIVSTLHTTGAERLDDEAAARANACRILVADDNRDAAESMSLMLRLMGNEVRTVHDGVQAVEEAAAFRPDVVLLDIGMPRLNGYGAARKIRAERWGKAMTLVALTGWGQEDDKRKASDAGFDHHFTKPASLADLDRVIKEFHAGSGSVHDPAKL